MKHAVIAATAAALIAGSAVTYAANGQGGPGERQRWQPSAEDRAILTDSRIVALKTALKLTPDQEKLWPAVETALKDAAKNRFERREAARAARKAQAEGPIDPITRMRSAADRMDATAGDLRKIADASEPLYKTLDEAQKRRLSAVMRQNFRDGMKRHHWRQG